METRFLSGSDVGRAAERTVSADGRDERDPLAQKTRRRVYRHVTRNPGQYLRQMERDLDMPLGTLEYHLRQLEAGGLVVTRSFQRYKSFFPVCDLDRRDRDVLYFLRQEMPRRLALMVTERPGIEFGELCDRLPVAPSTVFLHLTKLVDHDIILREKSGRKNVYTSAEPDRIRRLVTTYRASFADEIVERFADAWFDIRIDAGKDAAADASDAETRGTSSARRARHILLPERRRGGAPLVAAG